MSDITTMVSCYICRQDVEKDKALEVPVTTGGNVFCHHACIERYLKNASQASACSSCTPTDSSSCNSCPSSH